jgi:acyl-CoA thioester hydrolase
MSEEQPAKPRARRKPAATRGSAKPKTAKTPPADGATVDPQSPNPAAGVGLIRVPLSVRWRDLDAFNHVNNSKFLSYLEEARLRWMMTLPGEWIDDNVAPVVAAAHINYRRPIAWPNEIVVELFVERLGRTSLTIGHRILDRDDAAVLYADGNVVMVWIDKQRGQPAALPDIVRSACDAA